MSKVHLIESCEGCIYQWYGHCVNAKADIDTWEDFPDWCPLPDLPEKKWIDPHDVDMFDHGENYGWNACLGAITGEVEV